MATFRFGGNAVLEMSNTTLIFVTPASGFDVAKGGALILNACTLQGSGCNAWSGIDVHANPEVPHPVGFNANTPNTHPQHGAIIVNSGSTIRDAQIAIESRDIPAGYPLVKSGWGGAIIQAADADFVNNLTGIYYGRFDHVLTVTNNNGSVSLISSNQSSSISGCSFINESPFVIATMQNYMHISLYRADDIIILGNEFTTPLNATLAGQERGTGIKITSTRIDITQNEFFNLYHGIDVYSAPSLATTTNILSNSFEKVKPRLTMNNTFAPVVDGNVFSDIPSGNGEDVAYGTLMLRTQFLRVMSNTYFTNCTFNEKDYDPIVNPNLPPPQGIDVCYARGLVVIETNVGRREGGTVRENTFGGSFEAATQIEGNNGNSGIAGEGLQFSCNNYDQFEGLIADMDWFLPNVSLETNTSSILNPQGICYTPDPSLAFRNHWHPVGSAPKLHIRNEMNTTLVFNYATGNNYDTDLVEGLVSFEPCRYK
ncbi:MAG: hypothetical protein R2798_14650 [Chitinophagales bacterium]